MDTALRKTERVACILIPSYPSPSFVWPYSTTYQTWNQWQYAMIIFHLVNYPEPGARPTKHISIEFEIRWKFRML